MTWQQISGATDNAYAVNSASGTYSASYSENVIAQVGSTVELPSPQSDEAVMVSPESGAVEVTTATGLIEGAYNSTYVDDASVIFVSDGSDWYYASNTDFTRPSGSIPNSLVTRPSDDDSFNDSDEFGVVVETSQYWNDIEAKISNNVSGATRAYIYDFNDGTLLGDKDISTLSSGDIFNFGISLDAGGQYSVVLDAEGSSYTVGRIDGTSDLYPYTSTDGELKITGSIESGAGLTSFANNEHVYSFTEVGDLFSGRGIPKIGDHHWFTDESSGTVLNDSIGSINASITGASWETDPNAVGGQRLSYDGDNDFWETDSTLSLGSSGTIFGWVRPNTMNSFDPYIWAFGDAVDVTTGAQGGIGMFTDTAGELGTYSDTNGNSGSSTLREVPFVSSGNWGFFALTYSGNSRRLITYDNSQEIADQSGTASRSFSGSKFFFVGALANTDFDGETDFFGIAEGEELSKPQIRDIWEATKR